MERRWGGLLKLLSGLDLTRNPINTFRSPHTTEWVNFSENTLVLCYLVLLSLFLKVHNMDNGNSTELFN